MVHGTVIIMPVGVNPAMLDRIVHKVFKKLVIQIMVFGMGMDIARVMTAGVERIAHWIFRHVAIIMEHLRAQTVTVIYIGVAKIAQSKMLAIDMADGLIVGVICIATAEMAGPGMIARHRNSGHPETVFPPISNPRPFGRGYF